MDSTYDIFSGRPDQDPVWIEAVRGLELANQRIRQIAAEKPGKYFLFCSDTNTTLTFIVTFAESQPVQKSKSSAA